MFDLFAAWLGQLLEPFADLLAALSKLVGH